jgi:NAD(P)-dependent dehydrogenase (short-subunit alcohol dehydrogenase family)
VERAALISNKLRTALVTGGAVRIGEAIVRDLAKNNFAVAIHANGSIEAAEALAHELRQSGTRCEAFAADLTNWNQCSELVKTIQKNLGPLDLLVNNASIFEDDSISALTKESFERHFAIHVQAPSILVSEFSRLLPKDVAGVVVNVIDQRVWSLNPRFYSYTLSKAALWTATQTMAQALAPRIRVNAIGPGPTVKNNRQTEEDFAAQINGLILKAGPALDEFGSTIRFLYDTPSITGQMIAIDGGQHLAWETPDVAEIKE